MSSPRMLTQSMSILVPMSGWISEHGVVSGSDANDFFLSLMRQYFARHQLHAASKRASEPWSLSR